MQLLSSWFIRLFVNLTNSSMHVYIAWWIGDVGMYMSYYMKLYGNFEKFFFMHNELALFIILQKSTIDCRGWAASEAKQGQGSSFTEAIACPFEGQALMPLHHCQPVEYLYTRAIQMEILKYHSKLKETACQQGF